MSGLLTPDARLRVFGDTGVVLPGAKLYTYVAGSLTTPLATYSDSALSVANTNPVVASAGGLFGPIYLTLGVAYQFLLKDSSGVTVPGWPQDNVMVPSAGYTDGSTIKAADGTVSLPGVEFNSDPDSGLFREGTNAIALATNGVKALGIDSTQFIDSPTQPRCVAYHNTTQSLTNATETVLLLNSEDIDVGGMHDTVTNNSRVTIPTGGDGLYLITATAFFATSVNGDRQVAIKKNGTTDMAVVTSAGAPAIGTVIQVTALLVLVATDYVEVTGYQSSSGALNSGSVTRSNTNSLSVVKLW